MNKTDKNRLTSFAITLLFFLSAWLPIPAFADEIDDVFQGFDAPKADASELSDVLGGFEDGSDEQFVEEIASSTPSPLYMSGSLGVAGAVNLASHRRPPGTNDRQGLAKLRGEADLTADLDLGGSWKARVAGACFYDVAYRLRDRDNYTTQTLDEYEDEAEFGEVWLQGSPLPGLDLKIGRQIVVWGKSDNIRVIDILNPMDQREPGMTDIEDLRLPVTMSRLDYSLGSWILTGIVVHEARFNKLPTYGSDYYSAVSPLPEEEKPNFALDNQELAMSVNGIFSGWETSFYAAHVFDDTAHVEMNADGGYKRVHARVTMFGAAVNHAQGNWIYKTEAALLTGLEFTALPDEEKTRLDILGGVEYSGFTDTTISLEAVNRHVFDFEACMHGAPDSADEDEFQWAFRISRDFFHERLETVLLAQIYDALGQGGSLERLEFAYDLNDNWETTVGVVLYQSGDKSSFSDLNDCNRLFFKLNYLF